ncbi:MAG: phosphodiesterase [Candidatus Marinimicrobia bacterium]|jgi:3',5'-cyclic AMP phosphodiesterase CpdA|nr:phosphodiesterase [Candidatus Neomarinimicrobiota bacterium]
MLIAQISDTHIPLKDTKTYGIAPMAENLVQCIANINQHNPKPDVVLVTGDITNTGQSAEFKHAAYLLDQIQTPFYVIPGNHDDRDLLRSTFGKDACPVEADKKIDYVIENDELRLIALDSTMPGNPGGEITTGQAQWLNDKLKEMPNQPTLIFMHHPPVNCGVLETNEDGFIGKELLGDVIKSHDHVEKIICGHIHLPINTRWCGTVISTAPSLGMKLALDLTLTRESEFYLEAPAYQLHYWTPENNLITHTVNVKPVEGPFLFKNQ